MRRIWVLLLIAIAWTGLGAAQTKQAKTKPAPPRAQVPAVPVVPLNKILADPVSFKKGPVRLRGAIFESPEHKGWYYLEEGTSRIRVIVVDYTIPPPQGINGDRVQVEGFVAHQTVSPAEARFVARDPQAAVGRQQQVVFKAYRLERLSVPRP